MTKQKGGVALIDRRSSTDAWVELALEFVFAVVLGMVVHYASRGRDWVRFATDDPELYARTEGEREIFLVSA